MREITFPPAVRSKTIIVRSDQETFSRLFPEGEIITGKVISQIDANHAILRLKGQNVLVEMQVPLEGPEEKAFQIEATSPQVILKLLPEAAGRGSPADWLKRYLSYDVPGLKIVDQLSPFWKASPETLAPGIRETADGFLKLLQTFSVEDLCRNPGSFREAIVRSGLFFENRLKQCVDGATEEVNSVLRRDIKGMLLALKSLLNSSGDSTSLPGSDLAKGVEMWVRKLELFQLVNHLQPDAQEKILLLIPLWSENYPQLLELNISLPRRRSTGDDERDVSVVFLLHLPALGRIHIDLKMKGKNLYCLFRVSEPGVAQFMDPFLPQLKSRLDGLGFNSYFQLSTGPMSQASSSLVSEVGEELTSLLSVVV